MLRRTRDSRSAKTAWNYKVRGRRTVGGARRDGGGEANVMGSERVKMVLLLVVDDAD
jgi:hypothetical protein